MRLLHIVPRLDGGGAARTAIDLVHHLRGEMNQTVGSLALAAPRQRTALESIDVDCIDCLDQSAELASYIDAADLVLLHFWNTPATYRFLQSPLPAMRLAIWCHVSGLYAPQVITHGVATFADTVMVANPSSLESHAVAGVPHAVHVPALVDFSRLQPLELQTSASRVGYLGTVDFVKMHRDFVGLCNRISPRNIRFPVWGPGTAYRTLQSEAKALGCDDRFEWNGPTNDVGTAFGKMDVFGYPLCADTYAASDRVLAEAMWVGLAPVTFYQPATKHLVRDGETGLVVTSPAEYADAIQRLIADFSMRKRLGQAAMEDARTKLSPEAIALQIRSVLDDLLKRPKLHREFGDGIPKSGSDLFIESLGDQASYFRESMTSDTYCAADLAISKASPALANSGGGGIVHYRIEYQSDPYLRFWTGLVFAGSGRNAFAKAEFEAARRLGMTEQRINSCLAMLDQKSNAQTTESSAQCGQTNSTPL